MIFEVKAKGLVARERPHERGSRNNEGSISSQEENTSVANIARKRGTLLKKTKADFD